VVRCGQISSIRPQEGISRRGIEIVCKNLSNFSVTTTWREVDRRRIIVAGIKCTRLISAEGASTTKVSTDLVVEILMRYVKTRIGWVLLFLLIVLLV
jgi:hypothetical protein